METNMRRIGLLTSGGDCQALNAAMRGVVKSLINSGEEVEIYGFLEGYRGLIYGNYRMLSGADFSPVVQAVKVKTKAVRTRDFIINFLP